MCQIPAKLSGVLSAANDEAVGRHALRLGIAFARAHDLQLFVVHAIAQLSLGDPTGFGITAVKARELHHDARERILVELGDAELQRRPEIRVISGAPEPAIMELIEQCPVDPE